MIKSNEEVTDEEAGAEIKTMFEDFFQAIKLRDLLKAKTAGFQGKMKEGEDFWGDFEVKLPKDGICCIGINVDIEMGNVEIE